ncbi:MAG: rod shape-determining protein MreD [Clostridium sp.]|nr:rod shape-determining protein MreD [Clostridium sp.]
MSKIAFNFFIKVVLLVLAQAVIFNNLVLFGVAVPLVFIYAIISMPITWPTNLSVTIGFLLGLIVDVFSNTYGVNALACTTLAFARKPIFHLYVQRDDDLAGLKPSQRSMGSGAFLKYMVTMTLAYCALAITVDAFAVFNFWKILLQILSSAAFTSILIYALDSIFTRQQ